MKLKPIRNPHSLSSKVERKSKAQEWEERLMKTKQKVLEKYANKKTFGGTAHMEGGHRHDNMGKTLHPQLLMLQRMSMILRTKSHLSQKVSICWVSLVILSEEGYVQAFVDFFYLNHQTPSFIEPSEKLQEDY